MLLLFCLICVCSLVVGNTFYFIFLKLYREQFGQETAGTICICENVLDVAEPFIFLSTQNLLSTHHLHTYGELCLERQTLHICSLSSSPCPSPPLPSPPLTLPSPPLPSPPLLLPFPPLPSPPLPPFLPFSSSFNTAYYANAIIFAALTLVGILGFVTFLLLRPNRSSGTGGTQVQVEEGREVCVCVTQTVWLYMTPPPVTCHVSWSHPNPGISCCRQ